MRPWARVLLIIGGGLVMLVLAYLAGNWCPVPSIANTSPEFQRDDFYSLLVSTSAAICTLLAVLVALFKEDLRKLWRYAALEVAAIEDGCLEEVFGRRAASSRRAVTSYECRIVVTNIGKEMAKDCRILVERLEKGTAVRKFETVGLDYAPLTWAGSKRDMVSLPPTSKAIFRIVTVSSPEEKGMDEQDEATSDDGERDERPILMIGDKKMEGGGDWIATVNVSADNVRPVRARLMIKWSGRWEPRLAEMKGQLSIELERVA